MVGGKGSLSWILHSVSAKQLWEPNDSEGSAIIANGCKNQYIFDTSDTEQCMWKKQPCFGDIGSPRTHIAAHRQYIMAAPQYKSPNSIHGGNV